MAEDNKYYSEISLDELEGVSGGKVKLAGYALLKAYIWQMKQLDHTRDEAVEAFIDGWDKDCEFRKRFTDGTDGDMQTAISFINDHWT